MYNNNLIIFFLHRIVNHYKYIIPMNVVVFVIILMIKTSVKIKKKKYGIQILAPVNVLKKKNAQQDLSLITIHAGK